MPELWLDGSPLSGESGAEGGALEVWSNRGWRLFPTAAEVHIAAGRHGPQSFTAAVPCVSPFPVGQSKERDRRREPALPAGPVPVGRCLYPQQARRICNTRSGG